jgi:hypothetical protein
MGAIFTTQIASWDVRESTKNELKAKTEKITTGQAKPEKFLFSASSSTTGAAGGKGKKGAAGESKDGEFDPLSMIKPVDIAKKLPSEWCDEVVSLTKWAEQKDKLSELTKLAETNPKIEIGPSMTDVVGVMKKLLKEKKTHAQSVQECLKCITIIAKGAKKPFGNHARYIFQTGSFASQSHLLIVCWYVMSYSGLCGFVLERLGEQKANLRVAAHESMDSIFAYVTTFTLNLSQMSTNIRFA